jgi:ABC-type polysaccharide/polyol phosphate export permease
VLLIFMLGFGRLPRLESPFAVPALLAIASATALGTGFPLAALNVQYRDVRGLCPSLAQIWT